MGRAGTCARIAAAVLLLAALVPARASDTGAGCGTGPGKTFTGAAACHLTFRGFPITVFADATATGTAEVHVWATVQELDGTPVVIVECTDKGSGIASCSNGVPDETTVVDNYLLAQATLRCRAQARGTATYRCVSGSGR